jgi:hypothetical protein
LFSQFKLNRATGFLLHDHGSLSDVSGHCNITDPQGHQITTAELAVNGQVKQCKVTPLPLDLESDTSFSTSSSL